MTDQILFLDIDGCLSGGRFARFDLEKLSYLRTLTKGNQISIVLSSGRSQPYMEAIAQILDTTMPYICENGAYIFDPATGANIFETNSTDLEIYRLELESLELGTLQFEPGKSHSLSFRVINDGEILLPSDVFDSIRLKAPTPKSLQITYSNSAIDVIPSSTNKSIAAEFLAHRLSIDLTKAHAFGDSNNDIELLFEAGFSGAPANASFEVKKIADFVSRMDNISGIIDHIKKNMLV